MKFLNIKYTVCKCIRVELADPLDWEGQEQETIKNIDGHPFMDVYVNDCKCSPCQMKERGELVV